MYVEMYEEYLNIPCVKLSPTVRVIQNHSLSNNKALVLRNNYNSRR